MPETPERIDLSSSMRSRAWSRPRARARAPTAPAGVRRSSTATARSAAPPARPRRSRRARASVRSRDPASSAESSPLRFQARPSLSMVPTRCDEISHKPANPCSNPSLPSTLPPSPVPSFPPDPAFSSPPPPNPFSTLVEGAGSGGLRRSAPGKMGPEPCSPRARATGRVGARMSSPLLLPTARPGLRSPAALRARYSCGPLVPRPVVGILSWSQPEEDRSAASVYRPVTRTPRGQLLRDTRPG